MALRRNSDKASILIDIGIILIAINLFMPVSNAPNTINPSMMLFASIVLCVITFYLNILGMPRKYEKRELYLNIMYVALLLGFSFIFASINPGLEFKWGELFRYITLLLLLNLNIHLIGHKKFAFIVYAIASFLIIIVGVLEAINYEGINEFLRTYYVNHYPHIYTSMILSNKTVTFFATHSISCYVYLFLFMGWEFYSIKNKSKLSWICRIGLLLMIILCKSISAILCLTIVIIYYLIKYRKRLSKNYMIVFGIFFVVGLVLLITNSTTILTILNSRENGILGRYFGGTALLSNSIKYIFSFGVPTGFYNLDSLSYTDSGYVVYMLRGGIGILIIIDIMVYKLFKRVFNNTAICKTLYFCILMFDFGYPILISQRFAATFLLVSFFIITCCSFE